MKGKAIYAIGFVVCVALMLALPITTFALSDRPRTDAQGNILPETDNPFAQGDAIRYGGLFGPVKELDPAEQWILEHRNPEFMPNPFDSPFGTHQFARNSGFARDQSRYIPINRSSSSY